MSPPSRSRKPRKCTQFAKNMQSVALWQLPCNRSSKHADRVHAVAAISQFKGPTHVSLLRSASPLLRRYLRHLALQPLLPPCEPLGNLWPRGRFAGDGIHPVHRCHKIEGALAPAGTLNTCSDLSWKFVEIRVRICCLELRCNDEKANASALYSHGRRAAFHRGLCRSGRWLHE